MRHIKKSILSAFLLLFTVWLPVAAQTMFIGGDGGSYRFYKAPTSPYLSRWTFVYTPRGYEDSTNKVYPTIVFFHGKGAAGSDSSKIIRDPGSLPQLIAAGFRPYGINPVTGDTEDFIVICSQDLTGATWPVDQNKILKWLRTAKALRVDTNAIFATGLSFGGAAAILYGTWDSAQALIPAAIVSASPMADLNYKPNLSYLAKQHVPVWFWSSSYDPQRTGYAKTWAQKYIDAGGDAYVQVTNYKKGANDGHCCWENLYSGKELYPGTVMKYPSTIAEHMDLYSFFLLYKKVQAEKPPVVPPAADTINYSIQGAKKITITTSDGKTIIFQ